jgi:hypothetical protein
LREKIPPSEPILAANLVAFNAKKTESLELLASINLAGEPEKLVAKTRSGNSPAGD